MLFLLLLTDVLMYFNRFSKYLQNKNLIFATIGYKFVQLRETVLAMKDMEGPSFKGNVMQFLWLSAGQRELACQLRDNDLLREETIEERTAHFNLEIKKPFLTDIIQELDQALPLNDHIFLTLVIFNVTSAFTETEHFNEIKVLLEFYGMPKSSTFKKETNMAAALINKENITEDSIRSFFINFDNTISCAQDKLNATIRELVRAKKLESHKVES